RFDYCRGAGAYVWHRAFADGAGGNVPAPWQFPRFPHHCRTFADLSQSGRGANGQRQAMYLEKLEGFGEVILRNFVFGPHGSFMVFSNSGVNGVVIDVALGAKERGMPLIGVVSMAHCLASPVKHSSGKRLPDIADVTLDNCTPVGDAMVHVEGLEY